MSVRSIPAVRAAAGVGSVLGCGRQLSDGLRAKDLQFGRHAVDRVAAPVKTQRFLLVGELLNFGPRLDVGGTRQGWIDRLFALCGRSTEKLRLAEISVALPARSMFAGQI